MAAARTSAAQPTEGRGSAGRGSAGRGSAGRAGAARTGEIRIGFVPLLDAVPLIAAHELRYFADEGLRVTLHRQIGWGNVRDKLAYGHLHASHALLGMPPASVLGRERFPEPLVSIMALGTGGDAITFSWRLVGAGADSPSRLPRWVRARPTESAPAAGVPATSIPAHAAPALAHVFSCSVHHYLLREWLSAGGADPDRDVRLCVLPPPQMPLHMAGGYLDGFCAGEPWNTLSAEQGSGKVVAVTTDVVPDHPDKVLAVRSRWLAGHGDVAAALVRAVLRGCQFCDDPGRYGELAEMLAKPEYIGLPADTLLRSLRGFGVFGPAGGRFRSCAPRTTFPSVTHAGWLVKQMARWGHVPPETDAADVARRSVESAPYRRAAEAVRVDCPDRDAPPMRLREGWLELERPPGPGQPEAAAMGEVGEATGMRE